MSARFAALSEQRLTESARVPFERQKVAETMAPACFMPGNSEVLTPSVAKRVRAEVRSSEDNAASRARLHDMSSGQKWSGLFLYASVSVC